MLGLDNLVYDFGKLENIEFLINNRINITLFLSFFIIMVVKTELCTFSEWKIYPGKGVRYVAKDGRPFLYLSKRNRNFSLRYSFPYSEN